MSYDARFSICGKKTGYGFESITVNTAIGCTTSLLTKVKTAFFTLESGQIRYRYDGTDPTDAIGHLMNPMDSLMVEGEVNIRAIRFIKTGVTNGTLRTTYEK